MLIFEPLAIEFLRIEARGSRGGPVIAPILVVRIVSRRFRWMVNDIEFWRNESLDYSELLNFEDCGPRARYLRTFLKNDDLKRALSPKTDREYSFIQKLFATACVPESLETRRASPSFRLSMAIPSRAQLWHNGSRPHHHPK